MTPVRITAISAAPGWYAHFTDSDALVPLAGWALCSDGEVKGYVAEGDLVSLVTEHEDFVGYLHELQTVIDPIDEKVMGLLECGAGD